MNENAHVKILSCPVNVEIFVEILLTKRFSSHCAAELAVVVGTLLRLGAPLGAAELATVVGTLLRLGVPLGTWISLAPALSFVRSLH